jgi:phosphatidate cytidylyltransferase
MLRWRLALGILIVSVLIGLCWLDHLAPLPGMCLFPLLVFGLWMATGEVLDLAQAGGIRPIRWTVHAGNLLVVSVTWVSSLYFILLGRTPVMSGYFSANYPASTSNWILLALAAGVMLIFLAEMRRFERPGGVTVNVAAAVFAVVYLGTLLTFLIQLRMSWGIAGLASVVIVTKMGDIGAYTVGRLFGRNKMAPGLSPGKTMEGAAGAIVFSVGASAVTFLWLVPVMNSDANPTNWWGWGSFGVAVCLSGIVGDLAESLIKRDVEQKDSSRWIPGFGGVLDILDSLLLAAPVAYAFWAFGLVG